jgi:drug/metabolite transporter (DMT)-like permease
VAHPPPPLLLSSPHRQLWPACILVVVNLVFAFYTVLTKLALSDAANNPIVIAFLREVIASSVLFPTSYALHRRDPRGKRFLPAGEDLGYFLLLGLLMVWGVQLLSALALVHITASNYALLAPSVPVITLIIALATGYEHFNRGSARSWLKVGSILITVGGAAYIAATAFLAAKPAVVDGRYRNPLLGNAFLITNKASTGVWGVGGRGGGEGGRGLGRWG